MRLDLIGARYGQLPSSMIGLPIGSWEAFQFDTAVSLYGRHVEQNGRPRHMVDKERIQANQRQGKQRQADPRFASWDKITKQPGNLGLAVKKMALPESGIW